MLEVPGYPTQEPGYPGQEWTLVIQMFGGCSVFTVLFLKWFLSMQVGQFRKQHCKNTASQKNLNYLGLTDGRSLVVTVRK